MNNAVNLWNEYLHEQLNLHCIKDITLQFAFSYYLANLTFIEINCSEEETVDKLI